MKIINISTILNMRHFSLSFSFFILFLSLLNGQNGATSSLPFSEKKDSFPSQIYQKARHMPWALKYEANGFVRDNDYYFNRFGLISELRVSKKVSMNVSARTFRNSRLLFQDALVEGQKKAAWQWELSAEPRWHFIKHANTFVGNYVGLRFLRETGYRLPETTYRVLATLGSQQFFFSSPANNIINAFDGSVALGISYQKTKGIRPSFQVNMLQGAVLNDVFRKYKSENAPPNRVKEYQALTDQNYLLKLDLFNLVTKADERDLVGEIRVGYEQKIAKSSFSINIEGLFSPYRLKNSDILRGSKDIATTTGRRFGVTLEPRWYYDQKKRIANGKSGNNLLGNYISFEMLYQNQLVTKRHNDKTTALYDIKSLTFTPLWGTQQQFSKRIFYDFKLGWGFRTVDEGKKFYFTNFQSNIYADILIGLRFGA
jgi:hypothetical protein